MLSKNVKYFEYNSMLFLETFLEIVATKKQANTAEGEHHKISS